MHLKKPSVSCKTQLKNKRTGERYMKRKPKSTSGKKIISLLMTVIILVSAIAEFTNLTVSAAEYGSGTVNLAQGKTAYASSNQRGDSTVGVREVRFLTDGDTSSYIIMHQDDTDPWVYADLGAEYSVNKIAVYQGADSTYPNSYATRFTVEYTSDLSTAWQTAATVTGAVSGKNTVTFSPVTARYIRIHVQEKYADNASFLELMVYETGYDKAPEEEADTLRILFIGNSLTHYNDVAGKVKALFVANGQEVETETLIQLGKSLTYHASLPETKTTILNGDFDYAKIATACGCRGINVTNKQELVAAMQEALKADGPVVINCMIDCDDKVWPMVAPGASISEAFSEEDMIKN